jgi:hypothetical protein
MACFEPEKTIVESMLEVSVNGQPARMNDGVQDIDKTWNGKNLRGKVRIKIAACTDDGAFFLDTDEVVALGVVVMKITIHFFGAGLTERAICQGTSGAMMRLYQTGAVNVGRDDVGGQNRINDQ